MRDPNGREIHLIGVGLAGSLLACYFARRGLRVRAYESRSDMRVADISAGRSINLALANRGIHALRQVGLYEAIQPLLIPMRGRMLHDEKGELTFQPYGKDESEVVFSVSRGELNKLMMTAAEQTGDIKIFFDHPLTGVDFDLPELRFRDAFKDHQYMVQPKRFIATDGAGSVVRHAMASRIGFESTEDFLTHGYKELTIPPDADGGFRIDPNALHIWPRGGFMLIALPNPDGTFTTTLFLPHDGETSFASLKTPEAVQRFFEEVFPDAVVLLPNLLTEFFTNPTGALGTVRCWPWCVEDTCALLGDAAHAIVPFHGQGMNCAFEDCVVLDRCLDECTNWETAFDAYQKARKPDAEAIADMALENYVEMRDMVRDPKFHLQKQLAWELEKRHPMIFVPRYSMVMFHHVPYSEAQRRGRIQKRILDELTENIESLEKVDFQRADALISVQLDQIDELLV